MTHIYKPTSGLANKTDPARCRHAVSDPLGYRFYQCSRKATVSRTVDGEEYGFCSTHDPVAAAEKRAAKEAQRKAKYEADMRARDRKRQRPGEYRDVLRQIAAGHNDPRAIAREVLAKWEDAQ